MSDYLSNLLARSLRPGAAIRPRRASWFEPTPGVNVAAPWLEATTEVLGVPPPGTLEVSGRAHGQPAPSPDPVLEPPPALPISETAPAEVAPKPVPLPSRPSRIEPARTVSVHAEPEAPRTKPGVEGASEAPPRPRDATERPGIPALPPDAPAALLSAVEPDPPGAAVAPEPIRPKGESTVEVPERPPLADIASPIPQSVTPRLPRQPAVDAPTIKPNSL